MILWFEKLTTYLVYRSNLRRIFTFFLTNLRQADFVSVMIPVIIGYFFLGLLTLPVCLPQPAYLLLSGLTSFVSLASGLEWQVSPFKQEWIQHTIFGEMLLYRAKKQAQNITQK
jgi:hypothetical protein